MKIAIVTPYTDPEKGACSVRVDSFKEVFEREGHKVTIFAPTRVGVEKESRKVVRFGGVGTLVKELNRTDFDVVIGTSPPLFHSFVALVVCRFRGTPFVLDMRDLWTFSLAELGLKSTKSLKFRL